VPFKTGGGLLDVLFVTGGGGEASSAAAPADVEEKALSRLGPALTASRKRHGDHDPDGSSPAEKD
jgi:hypothetical protein